LSIINAVVEIIVLLGIFVLKCPDIGVAACWLMNLCQPPYGGILISTVSATQQAAMMISLMGLMFAHFIVGFSFFYVSSMPLPLRVISNVPANGFILEF
jgi:ABC-2 type transport system permease protein